MVKGPIIFICGVALGGATGYLISNIIISKKHEDELNSEIEEIRVFYQNKQVEICNGCGHTKEAQNNINVFFDNDTGVKDDGECKQRVPKKVSHGISEDDYFEKTNRGKKTEYNSFFKSSGEKYDTKLTNDVLDPGGPTDDDPDDPENLEEVNYEDDIAIAQMKRGIELISNIDYTERNGYDKEELFYYKKNEVLTDSDDEVVDGFFDVVGSDFLDIIEQGGSKVVYVRNNNFAKDFLITVLNERYEGDII